MQNREHDFLQSSHAGHTGSGWGEEKQRLRDDLLAWIRSAEHPGRALHFSATAAVRAMRCSPWKLHEVTRDLVDSGVLVRFDEARGTRHRGWGLRGSVPPRRSLAELLPLIASAPTPHEGEGRRRGKLTASEEQAPVTTLSDDQRKDVRTVAGLIADHAPGADGDFSRVTAEFLARTTPRDGRTVWALELEVKEWVDARARAKAAAHGKAWKPADSAWMRAKAATSVKLMLRYAGSIGWLSPDEKGLTVHSHAPELHSAVLKWRKRLQRRAGGRNEPQIRLGVTTLALFLTRRGEFSLEKADWRAVLADIEADADAGVLRKPALRAVHFVWRRVHLLQRVRETEVSQARRLMIVRQHALTRVITSASTATNAQELDFSGWVDADGIALTGLIEGRYGLRRWIWYTAGLDMHVAADRTMPSRTYEEDYLRWRKRTRVALTEVALDARLTHVALLTGWATRLDPRPLSFGSFSAPAGDSLSACACVTPQCGCTCSPACLLDLFDSERLARYATWRKAQPKYLTSGETGEGTGQLHGIFSTCRRATVDLAMIAEHDGAAVVHERLNANLVMLERLVVQAKADRDELRDCLAINAAWRGGDKEHGLQKLVRFRDLLVEDACAAAGSLSVDAQLESLRTYRAMPDNSPLERKAKEAMRASLSWRTASWAISLRRALLVQLTRKIPLREKALRNLTPSMLIATKNGQACNLWEDEAMVQVRVPGTYTKNGKPYEAAYVASDQVGVPAHEKGAARWLLELWFAPGGGRDRLLEMAPTTVKQLAYVFPAAANRGIDGHGKRKARTSLRMADGGLTADWKAALLRHHVTLGVDLLALEQVQGGCGIHSVRYLFGRYWAAVKGLLSYASDLLQHSNLEITKRRYCGPEGSGISHEVEAATSAVVGSLQPSAAALAIQNAELLREVQELRGLLAAS